MFSLFHAATSPYVRKVMVSAHCLGVADQIELLASAAHPVQCVDWRTGHPHAAAWFAEFEQHPAMLATRPVA
ncbi:hypothetical protein SFA35_11435 [Pseudomonas sp. HR96]|uniref:hypothetical protein n=1 Tax=Pseudomonas sp. HR96 TaxID=1027966 RepID=UPI002A75F673|nr:hypothetical protein [Pseudomonas sp. HR96]WPP01916.1 hypothetical protein SFA35_11435 [Pseudomonas sp. HR96]